MARLAWNGVIATLICVLTGCASANVTPGKITLQSAMEEVAQGLNKMYDARKGYPKSGLMPAEVTVVFNVSASATDEGKLYIEAGATVAEALKVAKAGAEAGTTFTTARGNTVTIKFTNVLYAPKDSLVMTKSPDEIVNTIKAIEKVGLPPMLLQ